MIFSSSTNDENACDGLPLPKTCAKFSSTSGASKRRKRREASKNVQKLSAYFQPIEPSLQSKTEVETVQCTEIGISHPRSELHDTCSTDHNVGDGCDLQCELAFGSLSYAAGFFQSFI